MTYDEQVDRILATANQQLDVFHRETRTRIFGIEPPARHPLYNTAHDPYRLIGALPEIQVPFSTALFGDLFGF